VARSRESGASRFRVTRLARRQSSGRRTAQQTARSTANGAQHSKRRAAKSTVWRASDWFGRPGRAAVAKKGYS
jgi:hypothetical protein